MGERSASLTIDSAAPIELPVYPASVGPDVIDVGALTSRGYFTYDPGFVSTASCDSAITYIDGDEGILLHRGYPIEQLAEHSDHLELCYLLLNGVLPNAAEKAGFVDTIKRHATVDDRVRSFYDGFRPDAHPMAIMCAVTRRPGRALPRRLRRGRRGLPDRDRPPAHRQDADSRGDDLQTRTGTAVHSSA